MEYKPNDFFVGVVDLFGVLMPGAIATFLLHGPLIAEAEDLGIHGLGSGAAGWVAFFVGSYVLGHIIFLFGAFADYACDWILKKMTPVEKDDLYRAATDIKRKLLKVDLHSFNTFQFAKAVMQFNHQPANAAIARLEADSKFFRSLAVILVPFSWYLFHCGRSKMFYVCLSMIVLCLLRYGRQRLKSTKLAFGYLVTFQAIPKTKLGKGESETHAEA